MFGNIQRLQDQMNPASVRIAQQLAAFPTPPAFESIRRTQEQMAPMFESMRSIQEKMAPMFDSMRSVQEQMAPMFGSIQRINDQMASMFRSMQRISDQINPASMHFAQQLELVAASPAFETIRRIEELTNSSFLRKLESLDNSPFDYDLSDLSKEVWAPQEAPEIDDQFLTAMENQLADELASCNDFDFLSDKAKQNILYIYHHYVLQIIIGIVVAISMFEYQKLRSDLDVTTSKSEVMSIARGSNEKFNREFLRAYRVVIGDNLRLRQEPGMKSNVIELLPIGSLVTIIDKTNKSWLYVEVEIDGEFERGWISRRYTKRFR